MEENEIGKAEAILDQALKKLATTNNNFGHTIPGE